MQVESYSEDALLLMDADIEKDWENISGRTLVIVLTRLVVK